MKIKIFYKFIIIGVLGLSIPSCFVGKKYATPDVVDHSLYRTDSIVQEEDSTTLADISWQDMFTDSFLIKYLNEGLENNTDINVAYQQIMVAEAYYKQGKAGNLPLISASGEARRNMFWDANGMNNFELVANLSWEVDIWGKIRSQKRATEANYLQSVAVHQAVKTRLIANIASLYYQLLSLDEQLRIAEETVINRESSLETTHALQEAGTITAVAVQQTEAQLHSARALVVELKRSIKTVENAFSILLGKEAEGIERGSLNDQEIAMEEIRIGFPAQLLRNRPDVMAAEYNLVNAFELTNVAKSNFYPSLNLSARGGVSSNQLDNLFSVNSIFASIAGSLTQPILNARQIRTQYEVAQSQQEIAYLNFKQSIITASREVSDALYTITSADELVGIKAQEFAAYDTAVEHSEALLNSGFANYLEVLTARQNALYAQLDLIDARFNRLNGTVELYRALGGGWE